MNDVLMQEINKKNARRSILRRIFPSESLWFLSTRHRLIQFSKTAPAHKISHRMISHRRRNSSTNSESCRDHPVADVGRWTGRRRRAAWRSLRCLVVYVSYVVWLLYTGWRRARRGDETRPPAGTRQSNHAREGCAGAAPDDWRRLGTDALARRVIRQTTGARACLRVTRPPQPSHSLPPSLPSAWWWRNSERPPLLQPQLSLYSCCS